MLIWPRPWGPWKGMVINFTTYIRPPRDGALIGLIVFRKNLKVLVKKCKIVNWRRKMDDARRQTTKCNKSPEVCSTKTALASARQNLCCISIGNFGERSLSLSLSPLNTPPSEWIVFKKKLEKFYEKNMSNYYVKKRSAFISLNVLNPYGGIFYINTSVLSINTFRWFLWLGTVYEMNFDIFV